MQIWRDLFRLRQNYTDPLDRQRAAVLIYISVFLAASGLVNIGVVFLTSFEASLVGQISAPLVLVVAGVLYTLVRRGQLRLASYLIVLTFVGLAYVVGNANLIAVTYVQLALVAIVAGALLRWREVILVLLVSSGSIVQLYIQNNANNPYNLLVLPLLQITAIAIVQIFYSGNIQNLLRQYNRDIEKFRRVSGFSKLYDSDADEQALFTRTINLLRDELQFTFAQVFLTDSNGDVQRRIYSGFGLIQITDEASDEQAYSAIREAVRNHDVLLLDQQSSALRRSHLLAGIRSGALVPLYDAGTTIGVLDVQSEDADAFSAVQLDIVRLLASQLSTALTQLRSIQSIRSDVQEQEEIIARQRRRLRELERTEQRTTQRGWSNYFEQRMGGQVIGYNLNLLQNHVEPSHSLNDAMQESLQSGDLVIRKDAERNEQHLSLPIVLADKTLGAISLTLPANRVISPRQQDMMRNVIQRLALALENRRLVEQSQALAQREAKANQVASKLLATTDMQSVLRTAAQDFNEALGAVQTHIYLEADTIRRFNETIADRSQLNAPDAPTRNAD